MHYSVGSILLSAYILKPAKRVGNQNNNYNKLLASSMRKSALINECTHHKAIIGILYSPYILFLPLLSNLANTYTLCAQV